MRVGIESKLTIKSVAWFKFSRVIARFQKYEKKKVMWGENDLSIAIPVRHIHRCDPHVAPERPWRFFYCRQICRWCEDREWEMCKIDCPIVAWGRRILDLHEGRFQLQVFLLLLCHPEFRSNVRELVRWIPRRELKFEALISNREHGFLLKWLKKMFQIYLKMREFQFFISKSIQF